MQLALRMSACYWHKEVSKCILQSVVFGGPLTNLEEEYTMLEKMCYVGVVGLKPLIMQKPKRRILMLRLVPTNCPKASLKNGSAAWFRGYLTLAPGIAAMVAGSSFRWTEVSLFLYSNCFYIEWFILQYT